MKTNKIDWELVNAIEEVEGEDCAGDFSINALEAHNKIENMCEDCPIDDNIAIFANYLQDKGYGNVEKAVKEVLEELYNCCELHTDKKINNTTIRNYAKNKYGIEIK